MAKILLAEDDSALASTIAQWLEFEKHSVDAVDNGTDALNSLLSVEYDAAILDWQMPGMSGVEVCQEFRAKGGATPIIVLTGKNTIQDKEQGLDSGADDYLTKPFHPKELAARIRALIRRASTVKTTVLNAGAVALDTEKHLVQRDGEVIHLQPTEFALLEFFMRNPNQVFSAEALLRRVWESETEASLDAIYTCIRRIRKKIDKRGDESIIRTVHGIGYGINPSF